RRSRRKEIMSAPDDTAAPQGKVAGPCALAIFGAAGDLTMRKLIPALHNLAKQHLLNSNFAVVGFARHAYDDAGFRAYLGQELAKQEENELAQGVWDWLSSRIHYVTGEFDDDAAFARLSKKLTDVVREHGTRDNVLYYLATAPEFFAPIAAKIGAVDLACEKG